MARIIADASERECGEKGLVVFKQDAGVMGSHHTIWGCGVCLHVYDEQGTLHTNDVLVMALALEDTLRGK